MEKKEDRGTIDTLLDKQRQKQEKKGEKKRLLFLVRSNIETKRDEEKKRDKLWITFERKREALYSFSASTRD